MNRFLLAFALALLPTYLFALDVTGNITTTRTWTSTDSPVLLKAPAGTDITVNSGATLTIDASAGNVEVSFEGVVGDTDFNFIVGTGSSGTVKIISAGSGTVTFKVRNGCNIVVGTQGQLLFTGSTATTSFQKHASASGNWGALIFEASLTRQSEVTNCSFSDCGTDAVATDGQDGALRIKSSTSNLPTLSNLAFSNCTTAAIRLDGNGINALAEGNLTLPFTVSGTMPFIFNLQTTTSTAATIRFPDVAIPLPDTPRARFTGTQTIGSTSVVSNWRFDDNWEFEASGTAAISVIRGSVWGTIDSRPVFRSTIGSTTKNAWTGLAITTATQPNSYGDVGPFAFIEVRNASTGIDINKGTTYIPDSSGPTVWRFPGLIVKVCTTGVYVRTKFNTTTPFAGYTTVIDGADVGGQTTSDECTNCIRIDYGRVLVQDTFVRGAATNNILIGSTTAQPNDVTVRNCRLTDTAATTSISCANCAAQGSVVVERSSIYSATTGISFVQTSGTSSRSLAVRHSAVTGLTTCVTVNVTTASTCTVLLEDSTIGGTSSGTTQRGIYCQMLSATQSFLTRRCNIMHNRDVGVDIPDDGAGNANTCEYQFEECAFLYNGDGGTQEGGIRDTRDFSARAVLQRCRFLGNNRYGAYDNNVSGVMLAENCYWGSATGPDVDPDTLLDLSERVNSAVWIDFDPFLITPPFDQLMGGNPAGATAWDVKESVGVDADNLHVVTSTPYFAWAFGSDFVGETQSAYQVQVATSPGFEAAYIKWDSTKISSTSAIGATYAGSTLAPATNYYARIQLYNQSDRRGPWRMLVFRLDSIPTAISNTNRAPATGTNPYKDATPVFMFDRPTDNDGDPLHFKIDIDSVFGFGSPAMRSFDTRTLRNGASAEYSTDGELTWIPFPTDGCPAPIAAPGQPNIRVRINAPGLYPNGLFALPNGIWYWRVTTTDGFADSALSSTFNFTLAREYILSGDLVGYSVAPVIRVARFGTLLTTTYTSSTTDYEVSVTDDLYSGDWLVIFVEGQADKAAFVTDFTGNDMAGLDLMARRVVVKPSTNAIADNNWFSANQTVHADIPWTWSFSNITFQSGISGAGKGVLVDGPWKVTGATSTPSTVEFRVSASGTVVVTSSLLLYHLDSDGVFRAESGATVSLVHTSASSYSSSGLFQLFGAKLTLGKTFPQDLIIDGGYFESRGATIITGFGLDCSLIVDTALASQPAMLSCTGTSFSRVRVVVENDGLVTAFNDNSFNTAVSGSHIFWKCTDSRSESKFRRIQFNVGLTAGGAPYNVQASSNAVMLDMLQCGGIGNGEQFDGDTLGDARISFDYMPPTGLKAIAGNNVNRIEWGSDPQSSTPGAGFRVYRETNPAVPPLSWTLISGASPIIANYYNDTNAVNGTLYYYFVTVMDGPSGSESAGSARVSAEPAPPSITLTSPGSAFSTSVVAMTVVGSVTHFQNAASMTVSLTVGGGTGVMNDYFALSPTLLLADLTLTSATTWGTLELTNTNVFPTPGYTEQLTHTFFINPNNNLNRPTISFNNPTVDFNTPPSAPLDFTIQLAYSANSGDPISTGTLELMASRTVTVQNTGRNPGINLSAIANFWDAPPSSTLATCTVNQTNPTENFSDGEYVLSARIANNSGLYSEWISRRFYVRGASASVAKIADDVLGQPVYLLQGTTMNVTVNGTGLATSPLPNFGADVTVNSATGGGTSMTVNLTVGQLAACGPRTFTTNSGSITGAANVAYPTDLLPTVTNAEPPRNPAIGAINVLLVNGAFFKSETDIATRGRMMGISWSRNYRSDISYNGPLGFNWIGFYYQRAIYWSGGQDHVNWFTADGRMEAFSGPPGFMTGPNGVYAVATRDFTHETITIIDRHGFSCLFNAQGRLQSCTDRNGNKTSCTYNYAGQLSRVTDDRGFYYDISYYAHGRVQKVEDKVWNTSTPRVIDYTYDSNGNLTEQKSPTTSRYGGAGAPYSRITYGYRYNAAHQLTACINPREFAQGSNPTAYMEIVYEGARVVAQRYGAPDQWCYIRYPAGGPVRVLDRRGLLTEYTVGGDGHATTVARYTGFFSVSTEEPLDHTVLNSAGGQVRTSDPISFTTSYGYNANHEVISVTYPRNNRTDYTYPNPTWQTSGTATGVADHTLSDTNATWTPGAFAGMFLQMGFGSGTRYYAITGNSATSIDIQSPYSLLADGWAPLSPYQVYTNNPDPLAKGNLLQVDRVDTIFSAANITTRYTYEPRFQFVKTVTNPRGYVTSYFYDYEDTETYGDWGAGNLIRVESPTISLGQSSPQTITTRTTYNEFGQPVAQTDGVGNATLFLYYNGGANNGFLYQRISSYGDLNLTSQFEYDQVGNLTRSWPARAFEPGATMNDYMTENVVNELNQTWKSTGPKLQQAGTIDDRMSVFRYFDFNGNLTSAFREYVTEGGTEPAVPSDVITPGAFTKVSSDMTATWVESKTVYNLLNLPTSRTSEFLNGSTIKQLTSLTFYDKSDNVIRSQTPLGNCSATVYDERDMVFQSVSGEFSDIRAVTESDYDPNGNLVRSRDALGNQSTSSYDGFDRGISSVDPAGNERTTIYDANSNAVTSRSFEGGSGQSLKLTESTSFFDEVDRSYMSQRMAKNYLGNDIGDGLVTNTTRFDPNGRVTWSMDDSGVTSYSFYDGANRTQRTSDNLGNEVEYEYNLDGAVTKTIYREINGLTSVPEVSHTETIYDLQNRRLKFRDQRYSASDPLKNTEVQWKYDGWSRVTLTTDAAGITTSQTYDWLSRALRNSRKLVLLTPSTWIVTDNAYDDDSRVGKRTIWEDPGTYANPQDTRYVYDERSRLTTLQRADGDIFSMTYDANSNLISTTDPVLTRVTNTYDNRNLIVCRYIDRGSGIKGTTFESYAFDAEGRLTSCSNYGDSGLISSSAWDYNTLSWPERQTQSVNTTLRGLRTYTVLSEFDATGFRKRINTTMPAMYADALDWPEETRTFVNSPDQLNRLASTIALSNSQYGGIPVAEYEYAGSRLIRRTYGCGVQSNYSYEASGCGCGGFSAFIEDIQHTNLANDEVIFATRRRYDKLGNVTVESRDHAGGVGSVYRYDNAYRLTSSYFGVDLSGTGLNTYADPVATPTTFGFKRTFNLDTRGNRTGSSGMSEVTDGGATLHNTSYVVSDPANGDGSNMNLYGSVDGLSYTYDATEQMTFDPSTGLSYEYDYKGQIVRKYGTGGTYATYKYDCQGRLVAQTDDQIFPAQSEQRAAETVTINDISAGCGGSGEDSKLGEENFTNDAFDPNPTLYSPIVSRAFYCPVLGAHGSGSSGAVHPLTAASPSSAPGQSSTFPGFQSLRCYEDMHDRFLLEDQLGSIIGELDADGHRTHEYEYLDYGQPISRPIVFDAAGNSFSVSGPGTGSETVISLGGSPLASLNLEGMELRVADPSNGTDRYRVATVMFNTASTITIWDTAANSVAALLGGGTVSFVVYNNPTAWVDGRWDAVNTSTNRLTDNDRDFTQLNPLGIAGYKIVANAANGVVFTVTAMDPADPLHSFFVTPAISGLVAVNDHYHCQGKDVPYAPQSGYFSSITGGTNTTFKVLTGSAPLANFQAWQVGFYLQPNTDKPSYHKILSASGDTLVVEGNCAALASTGPNNHFRVVAPPDVNGNEGGRVYDPVCAQSRYLWAGYRYEWPIVGHRLNAATPEFNQPGPDNNQNTWDGNALGQYHCWNREYDVLIGRWTRPDPLKSFAEIAYCLGQPLRRTDPSGLECKEIKRSVKPFASLAFTFDITLVDCNCCPVYDADSIVQWTGEIYRSIATSSRRIDQIREKFSKWQGAAGSYKTLKDSLDLNEFESKLLTSFDYKAFVDDHTKDFDRRWDRDNYFTKGLAWNLTSMWTYIQRHGIRISCWKNCVHPLFNEKMEGWVYVWDSLLYQELGIPGTVNLCCDTISKKQSFKKTLLHEFSHLAAYTNDSVEFGNPNSAYSIEQLVNLDAVIK